MFCQDNFTSLIGTHSTIFFNFIQDKILNSCRIHVNNGLGCNRTASQREADEVEQLPSCTERHWKTHNCSCFLISTTEGIIITHNLLVSITEKLNQTKLVLVCLTWAKGWKRIDMSLWQMMFFKLILPLPTVLLSCFGKWHKTTTYVKSI